MTLWLIRAGKHGEFEQRFLDEGRVFLTWNELHEDLSKVTRDGIKDRLRVAWSKAAEGKIANHAGQIHAFVRGIQPGDWFVLPSKLSATIHVGEITSGYTYDGSANEPFWHFRTCKWIERDLPRSRFDQDLLYSFGAFLTICRVTRNDAEQRVRAMAANNWQPTKSAASASNTTDEAVEEGEALVDLEQTARDQIASLIAAKFKGHDMERLVEAILRAQGYTTHRSPEGPDHGVDILAGSGPLGFGEPRICVQVKSSDYPLDRPTLDQLIGTMQNVRAAHGLLVSWGGFKQSVKREVANQFFRVRLWDQGDLINEVLTHYDRLDADLRAELPLKRIWAVTMSDDGEE
jgi:restriction system protein